MLQLRGDNEHFNSLPSLRALDHPRHSIITTDRPDSSQLVDLHIYVVPKNVWKDVQRLAQNEAMDDAVSAGFVRVPPNMTIRELRKTIEKLCGNDNNFPEDFIYLRSVGRCLTKVKGKQEDELRVKNYRPPQTFAPEIYLLEGHQEDYIQNSSVSPAPSSVCDICGNHDGHRDHDEHHSHHSARRPNREKRRPNNKENRFDHNENPSDQDRHRFPLADYGRSPSRLTQNYQRKPIRNEKNQPSLMGSHEIFSHNLPNENPNRTKFRPIGSDPEESATNKENNHHISSSSLSDVPSNGSSNLSKLKQEQERLRRRQAELERMRRAAEDKKARSQRGDDDRSRSDPEDEAAKKIQASFRGFKDRQDFQERKRNPNSLDHPKKVEEEKKVPIKNQPTYPDVRRQPIVKPASMITRHESHKPSNSKRSIPGGNNEYESTRHDISSFTEDHTENIRSNLSSSSSLSKNNQKQSNSPISPRTKESDKTPTVTNNLSISSPIDDKTTHNDEQNISSEDINKVQSPLNKSSSRTTPEMKSEEEIINEEIETERRNAETKRRRQLEEDDHKKKGKGPDDQRRKDLLKGVKDDPEALRVRHQEIRNRRLDLERVREDVIKHLKNIHNRITLRRKEARDMWKKKYFNEKKKHPQLDERIATLKNELDQMHKKTVQTMEAEAKYAAQMGYTKEADAGNSIAQIARVNHDIQDIRHQVEQAKLRLTTDVKLRNQAENECRSLKHELNQAKMNLNDIKKTRTGP